MAPCSTSTPDRTAGTWWSRPIRGPSFLCPCPYHPRWSAYWQESHTNTHATDKQTNKHTHTHTHWWHHSNTHSCSRLRQFFLLVWPWLKWTAQRLVHGELNKEKKSRVRAGGWQSYAHCLPTLNRSYCLGTYTLLLTWSWSKCLCCHAQGSGWTAIPLHPQPEGEIVKITCMVTPNEC